ncbi:MAG: BrnA antitoxin family protein [Sulfurisoma sp.]|nr:BrnA antitoxin family protein [Sulfurisoma sp.]
MKAGYDFSKGKRGAVLPAKGKTRITLYLDDDVLAMFREQADKAGRGYQTLINEALRSIIAPEVTPVTIETLRRVLREELHAA